MTVTCLASGLCPFTSTYLGIHNTITTTDFTVGQWTLIQISSDPTESLLKVNCHDLQANIMLYITSSQLANKQSMSKLTHK